MLNAFSKMLGLGSIVKPNNQYVCASDYCPETRRYYTMYEVFPNGTKYKRGCC